MQKNREKRWNLYRFDRSTQWAKHYDLFDIKIDKKYAQELYKLTWKENKIRMMLYTNHIPLNSHQHHVMTMEHQSPICDNEVCKEDQIEESIHHYLFLCPRYSMEREIMTNNVKKIYMLHNIKGKNIEKNKIKTTMIPFVDDRTNPIYAKQFSFPSFKMENNHRIAILKEVISYIIRTKRFTNL